ncbi:porin [Rhodoferax ferrireducens]|uniref:porin n=1 Tax=Rhodoferax ferrireducens TaxID=192843 RepID=UPI00286B0526|nr:porin [Rhodoferax ferrireducens]
MGYNPKKAVSLRCTSSEYSVGGVLGKIRSGPLGPWMVALSIRQSQGCTYQLCLERNVGLGVTCFSVMAQSSVTISGVVDVAIRQVRNGSRRAVNSEVSGTNATSKLILRGTEDFGGGLSAAFYLDGTTRVTYRE